MGAFGTATAIAPSLSNLSEIGITGNESFDETSVVTAETTPRFAGWDGKHLLFGNAKPKPQTPSEIAWPD